MKWSLTQFTLLLSIVLTIWLSPSIFGGKALMPLDILPTIAPFASTSTQPTHNALLGDMMLENLAWKFLQRDALLHGELPLWNPYSFCGHPLYATGQASTFYPFNLILVLIPLPYGYVVYTWLHLLAGGLFTYLFFRRIGVGGFGASVGGLMIALGSSLVVRLLWPWLLGSAVWLPLMLLWIDWMADASSRRWAAQLLAGAVVFAMPVLSGFFEITFYVFVACGLYAAVMGVRVWGRERRLPPTLLFFAKVGSALVLAVLLSAPQLLPFGEVAGLNTRVGGMSYERLHVDRTMSGIEAITYAVPDALGNPAKHEKLDLASRTWQPIKTKSGVRAYSFAPQNYVETMNYLGLLPLAFVILSVRARGQRRFYFWLLVLLGVAMAFVTPLYRVFLALVPGADQVRTPWRWLLLTSFAFSYLSAIGADSWYERLSAPTWRIGRLLATIKVAALAVLVGVMLRLLFDPAPLLRMADRMLGSSERLSGVFADSSDLAGFLWMNGIRFAGFALAAGVVCALAFLRTWSPRGRAVASLAAALLVAVDLGQATYDFNTQGDPALLTQQPQVLSYLDDQARRDVFRIGRYGPYRILSPNLPLIWGLQDFGGFDPVILSDYARYMQAIEPQETLWSNTVTRFDDVRSFDSPLFPLLNVRYVLSGVALEHPSFEQVSLPGRLSLYRLKDDKQLPRAFMVGRVAFVDEIGHAIEELKSGRIDVRRQAVVQIDPREISVTPETLVDADPGPPGSAKIIAYRPNRVSIETTATGRQFLVLCDTYYPGWRVYVNGVQARMTRADGIFRGVSVPAGSHTVEFRFQPIRLRVGLAVSGACLGLLIAGASLQGRRAPA